MLRQELVSTQRAQRHFESAFSAVSACFPLCGLCVNLSSGLFLAKSAKTFGICFLCGLCVFSPLRSLREPQLRTVSRKARKDSLLATCSRTHSITPCFGKNWFTRKARKDIWNQLSLRSLREPQLRTVSRKARKDSLLATCSRIHSITPCFGKNWLARKERKDIWNLLSLRSLRVFPFAVSA
jgi:hypothetical protein